VSRADLSGTLGRSPTKPEIQCPGQTSVGPLGRSPTKPEIQCPGQTSVGPLGRSPTKPEIQCPGQTSVPLQNFSQIHSAVSEESILNRQTDSKLNPLIATLKPQSNGPSYSNTVIGTLAVDWWAVTFGTARRGLGGAAAHTGPSSLYQM